MAMSDKTKHLIQKVMDGNNFIVPVMHQISHYIYRDTILVWLINNNITGYNLSDWLKINHNNSVLGMVKFIIMRHNKESEEKPIVFGKDWIQ